MTAKEMCSKDASLHGNIIFDTLNYIIPLITLWIYDRIPILEKWNIKYFNNLY